MGQSTPELFADLKAKAVARAVKHLHAAVRDRNTSASERAELLARASSMLDAGSADLAALRYSQRLALVEPLKVAMAALYEGDPSVRAQFNSDHDAFMAFVEHAITANR